MVINNDNTSNGRIKIYQLNNLSDLWSLHSNNTPNPSKNPSSFPSFKKKESHFFTVDVAFSQSMVQSKEASKRIMDEFDLKLRPLYKCPKFH
jgi:hypothetical protein